MKLSLSFSSFQIVFNPSTYPNFIRFLDLAQIPYSPTEMTFSVSRMKGVFEWAGRNLFTFFCQARNLIRLEMWIMLYDILRFNACARRILKDSANGHDTLTIGTYLTQHRYSDVFIKNYLIVSQ
jgi:predicted NAD/FAD-binding protein